MRTTKDLIEQAVSKNDSLRKAQSRFSVSVPLGRGIPTLKPETFQPFTPELKQRYELFGRWERATHGHWLGLDDMEALWGESLADRLLREIRESRVAGEENWPNEASALFKPERLSLFACSDISNEKIYLLWLEFEDEPELWVYDSNGESRYKDLDQYLEAYLNNDVSAAERRWKLSEIERLARKS
jgi:hypothetical protein